MLSNKSMGTAFENEFADMLYGEGFWVLNVTQNDSGQPADIVATLRNVPYLIDCKVCKNDRFAFSRMEDNQRSAMDVWLESGNTEAYFALKTSEGVYLMEYTTLLDLEDEGRKSLNFDDIETFGFMFEEWVMGL